jgi:hypothetical protein
MNTSDNTNLETRISNRLQSIFAAFGQVINDFYLEAGIYFVGGFNAALVAWDIYTALTNTGQPLAYAVVIAVIAFIAVEGLAVYLVGAAAKTNNGLLWFFSVVFAAFFTYAHYQEMSGHGGVIAQYITLAIPFFVVVGYWARTVKVSVEANEANTVDEAKAGRERQWAIEDEERRHKMDLERSKLAAQNEVKRLKAEGQISVQSGQISGQMNQMDRQNELMDRANDRRMNRKTNRRNDLVELVKVNPSAGPTELTKRLNEMGHSTSISTVKRDIKSLNGSLINS